MERPDFFTLKNGEKVKLPFSNQEYKNRVSSLRSIMDKKNLDMVILTSMHNIAYYTGFIYCSFGRPYGCVITKNKISTISANIDASQPWRRSHCDNIIYTDWKRDNFLRAIVSIVGRDEPPKNIGLEYDHITLDIKDKITSIFTLSVFFDIAKDLMQLRMIKSNEEIEIIKNGARIADLGGEEIVKNISEGNTELEIAIAGRDRMEREIAKSYPGAEYMDTWVWFQSGINTDGAHNPKTNRQLQNGDILSLNAFPMISGYYTALERTLFLDHADNESLKAWEANVKVHKRGLELIKPGVRCSDICNELNEVHLDPQVIDQGSIVDIDHPDLGIMRMPKPPANLKGQGTFPRSLAPILGFHNREVLSGIDIDNDTIERMEEREKQNRDMLATLMQAAEE